MATYTPFQIYSNQAMLEQCYCSLWTTPGINVIDSATLLALRTDVQDQKPTWHGDFYVDATSGLVSRKATVQFYSPLDGVTRLMYGLFVYFDAGSDGLIVIGRQQFSTPYTLDDELRDLIIDFTVYCTIAPKGN